MILCLNLSGREESTLEFIPRKLTAKNIPTAPYVELIIGLIYFIYLTLHGDIEKT